MGDWIMAALSPAATSSHAFACNGGSWKAFRFSESVSTSWSPVLAGGLFVVPRRWYSGAGCCQFNTRKTLVRLRRQSQLCRHLASRNAAHHGVLKPSYLDTAQSPGAETEGGSRRGGKGAGGMPGLADNGAGYGRCELADGVDGGKRIWRSGLTQKLFKQPVFPQGTGSADFGKGSASFSWRKICSQAAVDSAARTSSLNEDIPAELQKTRAYPFQEVEASWQAFWEENRTFRTADSVDTSKPKFYVLDMFPYPRFLPLC